MKIAVCGSAPTSRMLAPFNNLDWEIWACSPQNYDYPRVDAWFELHSLDRKFVPANKPYEKVLKAHPRVYVSKADERLPDAIYLDPKPLLAKYGDYFFTSSLAWMMAFAIEQKPEAIGLWGVDMSATDEYSYQRPGCHYFMQKAVEAGIELMLPPQCDLPEPHPLYGYKEHWPMYWKLKVAGEELDERTNRAAKMEEQGRTEKLILRGARDYLEYVKNTWLHDTRSDVPLPPLELKNETV
jgi:hypothetical protein